MKKKRREKRRRLPQTNTPTLVLQTPPATENFYYWLRCHAALFLGNENLSSCRRLSVQHLLHGSLGASIESARLLLQRAAAGKHCLHASILSERGLLFSQLFELWQVKRLNRHKQPSCPTSAGSLLTRTVCKCSAMHERSSKGPIRRDQSWGLALFLCFMFCFSCSLSPITSAVAIWSRECARES